MGAGTNRMNRYTVARAAEGFALHLKSLGEEACDAGLPSRTIRAIVRVIRQLSAAVFITNGLRVYFPMTSSCADLSSFSTHRPSNRDAYNRCMF